MIICATIVARDGGRLHVGSMDLVRGDVEDAVRQRAVLKAFLMLIYTLC